MLTSQQSAVTVFKYGEGGYPCIRIPSITVTPSGTLIAFAECRGWIGDGCQPHNIAQYNYTADENLRWICSKSSYDNGKTWSNLSFPLGLDFTSDEPTIVYDYIENKLVLQVTAYLNMANTSNQTVLQITSTDDGKTWSKPIDIGHLYLQNNTNLIVGPGTGLQLLNNPESPYYGRLLFIGYQGRYTDARVWFSDDYGKSYTLSDSILKYMDESQLVEMKNGSVVANMRNNHLWNCECRGISISNDYGTTFSTPQPDDVLISPVCQASTMSLNNGSIILFSNPDSKYNRTNLQIKKSMDDMNSWNRTYDLCPGCDAAYSCLTQLKIDAYFGILWETNITGCTGASCQIVFNSVPIDF